MSKLINKLGGYTAVPNSFIKANDVSHEAFRLMVALMMHTNGADDTPTAFPSYDRIKAITSISSYSTIAKALRALEDLGWIERRKRFGKSTVYTITSPTAGVGLSVLHGVESSPTPGVGKQQPAEQEPSDDDESKDDENARKAKLEILGITPPTLTKLTRQLRNVAPSDFEAAWQRIANDMLAAQDGDPKVSKIRSWPAYAVSVLRELPGVTR
jgi:hypothetical protein